MLINVHEADTFIEILMTRSTGLAALRRLHAILPSNLPKITKANSKCNSLHPCTQNDSLLGS